MFLFNYERISSPFIEQLGEKILSGQSAVLVGARYSGKRHVLYTLHRRLEDYGVAPVIEARFLDEAPVHTSEQVYKIISQAVAEAAPGLTSARRSDVSNMLSPLVRLAEMSGKPVTMLASNVDGITHHLARSFLEHTRLLVEEGKLIAVMSGEGDFHELVYGPKSEFNCAYQYVLQGYSEEDFGKGLDQYMNNLRFGFDRPDEMRHRLWELTGGNLYLLRMVLWVVLQARSNNKVSTDQPLTFKEIPSNLGAIGAPGMYGADIFRYATQLINREAACWDDVENLIQKEEVKIGAQENPPSRLELAGVAVRESSSSGQRLKPSSPIMRDFIRQHYDDRRFGDLYGRIGEWETAFARYRCLKPEARVRPLDHDDRGGVETTVSALCSSLYSEAARASEKFAPRVSEEIKKLFAAGCHYVLGFQEVTFWKRAMWQQSAEWQYYPVEGLSPPEEVRDRIANLLPTEGPLQHGFFPLNNIWSRYAAVAILPSIRFDELIAVVVSDVEKGTSISRDREALVKQLLDHFVKAHTHAITVDGIQIRGRVREKQIEIINSIFNSLGRHDLSVQNVLSMAASGLRQLEYRRVLFCLVDPEKQTIEGVLDHCAAPLESVAERISYSLSSAAEDIQPYVIATKRELIVEDAAAEPLADREVVRAGRMRSLALIPMLNPAKDAIGTILVERENGAVPSAEEVADLKAFGGQLAIAIEHCQRINLLERGLSMIPDPIFIVDGAERPQYANRAASELLGIPIGWRPPTPTEEVPPLASDAGPVVDLIHDSLTTGNRLASHIKGIGLRNDYLGAVVSNVIKDQRGPTVKTIGGLLRIQDLTYLYKVFEASRRIAEAHDSAAAMRYMLEAAELLGHKWGRLYLAQKNEAGDELFVSKDCFGYKKEESQKEADFRQGKVVLDPRSGQSTDWLCIERNEPVVFCWKEELDDNEPCVTEYGLRVINWKSPQQPSHVQKKPGDFWIDLPLMTTSGNVLGKICLQCDEDLQPENFVFLKVLSESFAQLLDAYQSFDREKRTIGLEVAERTMATLAHNIGTRLGALRPIEADYRDFEKEFPALERLNDKLEHVIKQAFITVNRANLLLAPINPKITTVDLASHIERAFKASKLASDAWSVKCPECPFEVEVDANFFETAFLEIVQNSLDAARDPARLTVEVCIEPINSSLQAAVITYRDNGPGISAHLAERVFEDFFSERPGKKIGTGLGLGFVRRVVEAHNGYVYCNGAGTRGGAEFVITLPRKQQSKEKPHVPNTHR